MNIFQANFPLGRHPDVRDDRPRLDRVGADEVRHGAEGTRQRVAEISEALSLEKGHAPAVDVMPRAPASLAETPKRETEICRRVRLMIIDWSELKKGGVRKGVQSSLNYTCTEGRHNL